MGSWNATCQISQLPILCGENLLTLAFLRVGMERILGESHIDARHHKSTKFISARNQILAALWISMESAGLGRIVSSKD